MIYRHRPTRSRGVITEYIHNPVRRSHLLFCHSYCLHTNTLNTLNLHLSSGCWKQTKTRCLIHQTQNKTTRSWSWFAIRKLESPLLHLKSLTEMKQWGLLIGCFMWFKSLRVKLWGDVNCNHHTRLHPNFYTNNVFSSLSYVSPISEQNVETKSIFFLVQL